MVRESIDGGGHWHDLGVMAEVHNEGEDLANCALLEMPGAIYGAFRHHSNCTGLDFASQVSSYRERGSCGIYRIGVSRTSVNHFGDVFCVEGWRYPIQAWCSLSFLKLWGHSDA